MPEMPFGHVNTPKIWNGTCTWQSGVTPFGWYDDDPQFQDAAVKFSFFAARRLGWPILDVELDSGSFFTCLEEAVTEYGNQIYQFKVRENYLSMEGGSTAIPANKMVVEPTLQRIVEISKNYGTEAVVGGNITLHTGFLDLTPGQQDYNLNEWAAQEGIVGGIEIRKVFWEAPPAILRYFDPYAGTGTGIQSLMDAFDFGSYSPGVNFMLMPVSADLLKIQGIEFNDTVRKAGYSFEVHNNFLRLFPIPRQGGRLRIEYYKMSDKRKLNTNISLVNAYSTHKMFFKTSAETAGSVTEIFEHNLGATDITTKVYWKNGEAYEEMLPASVEILSENKVSITFDRPTEGYVEFGYPEYGIVVPSAGGDPGLVKHCIDFSISVPRPGKNVRKILTHNLGVESFQDIQTFIDDGIKSERFIPANIEVLDPNNIAITVSESTTGHVVLQASYEVPDDGSDVITNVSEVPYENPVYSNINSVGRQWIFRYALALVRETLGYIRGKYSTVPIPDSEATLNQQDLLTDARAEKELLITQLRDMLDATSRAKQLEQKANETEFLEKTLKGVPMLVYIG